MITDRLRLKRHGNDLHSYSTETQDQQPFLTEADPNQPTTIDIETMAIELEILTATHLVTKQEVVFPRYKIMDRSEKIYPFGYIDLTLPTSYGCQPRSSVS